MAEKNNTWITKFLVGALWFVITTTLLTTISIVRSNDNEARARDICETKEDLIRRL